MTLIALVLLIPTPLFHPGAPDGIIRGEHVGSIVGVAAVANDQGSVSVCGDPVEGGERADGDWDDDEGTRSLLDWPVLPHVPTGRTDFTPTLEIAGLHFLRPLSPTPLLRASQDLFLKWEGKAPAEPRMPGRPARQEARPPQIVHFRNRLSSN